MSCLRRWNCWKLSSLRLYDSWLLLLAFKTSVRAHLWDSWGWRAFSKSPSRTSFRLYESSWFPFWGGTSFGAWQRNRTVGYAFCIRRTPRGWCRRDCFRSSGRKLPLVSWPRTRSQWSICLRACSEWSADLHFPRGKDHFAANVDARRSRYASGRRTNAASWRLYFEAYEPCV